MKTSTRLLLKYGFSIALASAGSWVWSASSDVPRPVVAPANSPQTIPEPYKILLTHSIFSRDGRAMPERPTRSKWGGSATTIPTQPATTEFVTSAPDPESGFVLRGVGMQDGVFTAFFEQTSESKGVSKHIGDNVARGQIMAMSLDGVDYACQGKVSHILIGQDLNGRGTSIVTTTTTSSSGDWRSKWHHAAETPAAAPAASDDRSRLKRDHGQSDIAQPTADPNARRDAKIADTANPGAGPESRPAAPNDGPDPFDFDPN